MYYVYLLKSIQTEKYYIGSTPNIRRRLIEHNQGKSLATKSGAPWKLIYFEGYPTKQSAIVREKKLKHHGKGLSELKRRIELG